MNVILHDFFEMKGYPDPTASADDEAELDALLTRLNASGALHG